MAPGATSGGGGVKKKEEFDHKGCGHNETVQGSQTINTQKTRLHFIVDC